MYRVINTEGIACLDGVMCMSNVRGARVKTPSALPFSFYFSAKDGVSHGPKVKVSFDPEKLRIDRCGTLKLCDDWKFIPGQDDSNVKSRDIREMKSFFKVNIVLFCLVWDIHVSDPTVQDYFLGQASLQDIIQEADFYEDYRDDLDRITDVFELDNFCRDNNLVNFYGN